MVDGIGPACGENVDLCAAVLQDAEGIDRRIPGGGACQSGSRALSGAGELLVHVVQMARGRVDQVGEDQFGTVIVKAAEVLRRGAEGFVHHPGAGTGGRWKAGWILDGDVHGFGGGRHVSTGSMHTGIRVEQCQFVCVQKMLNDE
ncbi:hypothetical protein ACQEWB_31135 [Streptomyces sp. CA-249302]|uniref:hypothetical protein n=1 Tax=Streptomyces sp. CA-249302 TaxID=3240058 RepID=UPI003D910480